MIAAPTPTHEQTPLLHLVLVEPRIAFNAGAIIRLCANSGAALHLVEPLGFTLDEAAVRRGGLDYHELAAVTVHESWSAVRSALGAARAWYAATASGGTRYDEARATAGDVIVLGCEPTGLPDVILAEFPPEMRLHIPMRPGNRSLNLANAASVLVYDHWRRAGFPGGAHGGTTGERLS